MGKLKITAEPGSTVIHFVREFDAPRALVFRAFTDPALIPQWWGPARYTTVVEALDAKAGGMWRFVQTGDDGSAFAFHGVFHALEAPAYIAQTSEFSGMPGHIQLETLRLEEHDGKTVMTAMSVFQSVEDRDGMMSSGMEAGAGEGYDRLEAAVKTL